MRATPVLLALALLAFPLAPASALGPNGEIVPTYRFERVYFQCQDQTVKVDNVQRTTGTDATWSTVRPTGAFAGDGDGCGSLDTTLRDFNGVAQDSYWAGRFTGNLRDLRVTLYDLSHRADVVGAQLDLIASLWVDGSIVVEDLNLTPTATSGNSGVTHEFSFSLPNLGFGVEDGNGTIERDIRLQLRSRDANFFAWGADEVPAGITFNAG